MILSKDAGKGVEKGVIAVKFLGGFAILFHSNEVLMKGALVREAIESASNIFSCRNLYVA